MQVGLFTHPSADDHRGPRGHPERPERLRAVIDGVDASGLTVVRRSASEVDLGTLATVHDPGYIRSIERFCAAGGGALDPDTYAVRATWEAALRAAGAGLDAIERLSSGFDGCAFSAMRPPGHHAERDRAMGFCVFNNIAVAAATLVGSGARVAIVDWDVHHGNGTQHTFYDDPRVLYVSLHQFPFYPGTGWLDETGSGAGEGFTVNLPLPAGSDGAVYRAAFHHVVVPVLAEFAPDWVLISAGYDAHLRDPLASMRLVADDYRAMAQAIRAVVAADRIVAFLEGGYDLTALTESVAATLQGVAAGPSVGIVAGEPGGEAAEVLARAVTLFSRWWELG